MMSLMSLKGINYGEYRLGTLRQSSLAGRSLKPRLVVELVIGLTSCLAVRYCRI